MATAQVRKWCLRYGFKLVFLGVALGLVIASILQVFMHSHDIYTYDYSNTFPLPTSHPPEEVTISANSAKAKSRDETCVFHTCFDVYHCGHSEDPRISVYIYPPAKYVDEEGEPLALPISKEYSDIVAAIAGSEYYTSDPERACLFLPPIDLLNQNSLHVSQASQILATLPKWGEGNNHVVFNMLPGTAPDYNTVLDVDAGKALIAGGGFDIRSYRATYDVSIPVFNPHTAALPPAPHSADRPYRLIASQLGIDEGIMGPLEKLAIDERYVHTVLVLDACGPEEYTSRCAHGQRYDYPHILHQSTFCTVVRSARLGQATLFDAMKFACIPVIIADEYVLPFSEVLDWTRAAVVVSEDNVARLGDIIAAISDEKIRQMQGQVRFLFENYFHSMSAITLTTIQILNDRVFPYAARKYEDWNRVMDDLLPTPPLFLPLMRGKQQGFTAVILAYDRLESLFKVISNIAKAPSLAKVLVVWNNQDKPPPSSAKWPKINKPLKVVKTTHNKLSNRFYPYEEIETEAVLALDDDIIMLNVDELEFGFRVWREFPDRLVGYPSRLHEWDNGTNSWRYESEWKHSISIVLTGAAFYHKYYSYLYTNALPGDIKGWVDEHFNCEDIAMNFLIANVTGKAPIKVAPRQKFKCQIAGCQGETILSANTEHMVQRSDCVNKFADIYGTMPLQTVEFRADPVLYKEDVPAYLKLYSDIGSL